MIEIVSMAIAVVGTLSGFIIGFIFGRKDND